MENEICFIHGKLLTVNYGEGDMDCPDCDAKHWANQKAEPAEADPAEIKHA